jgi:outer membrane protein OmpU
MKKILLATTMLAASAGYAAADIAFSGSAEMGIANYGGTVSTYSAATLDIAFSGTTDGGLTFGATTSISSGWANDGLDDWFSLGDGMMGAPEVYISGSFGRLAIKDDGYGFFHNDDDAVDLADVDYSGTFGAVSVGLRLDAEDNSLNGAGNSASVKLGYSANNLTIGLNADVGGTTEWDASVSYAMGQVTVGLSADHDNVTTLNLDYDNGAGMTAGIEIDSNDDWTLSGGYAANGMAINGEINSDDEWEVTGSYDLGGGLSIEGGVDNDEDMFVGAAMTF